MQPTTFTCSRCNAPLAPGSTQCQNCGQTFAGPVPYGPEAGYVQQPPQKKGNGLMIALVIILGGGFFLVLILAAILFPVFAKARDKAREISSRSNMKQIGLATMQYVQDYDEKLPPMESYDTYKTVLQPYIRSTPNEPDLFIETGANVPYQIDTTLSKKSIAEIADPRTTVLMKETVPHSDHMINVLYLDGHVESVPADSN